ncbi:MAG: adenylate/guanylate cyclase domain-containing protein [Elusimicrobiota bacterium]
MTEKEKLAAAIAAQETMRPMLGDAVVDMTVAALREKLAGLDAPADAAQRKLVTILFADVSGFTAMSETMDAEEVRDTMNSLWEKLDAAIIKHGGRVDKHIGDAVMAIFGVPAAKEDDPERAIRAALALQTELKAFAESAGRELKMRVGVNTGAALLGAVGSNSEFTAMGDAVNIASRLEHASPIGGILISHDSYLHVRGLFDVESQEPLQVKGKKDSIQTYIVKRAKPRRFRLGTRGLDIPTKMVGRDAEFKALQDGMETAFEDREAQMRTVVGDAGMGKSRLLYEFTQWFELHPRRFWYFAGRASPETIDAPYGLLRDLFSQRFEIGDGDAVSAVHAIEAKPPDRPNSISL